MRFCIFLSVVLLCARAEPLVGEIPRQIPSVALEQALKDEDKHFEDYQTADRGIRVNSEEDNFYRKFFKKALDTTGTTTHEAMYLLPFSYALSTRPQNEKDLEAKFQFSFKTPVFRQIGTLPLNLYFAYTQKSFWQLYNPVQSRPFRENNYRPELFLNYQTNASLYLNDWYAGTLEYLNIGYMHESNGGGVDYSRSWDRIVFVAGYKYRQTTVRYKLWARFKERPKENPQDAQGDDNPDILDYLGNGELMIEQRLGKHIFSATLLSALYRGKGSILLDYAYPMSNDLYWYAQVFTGYGESLYDYNRRVRRIGFGLGLFL